MRKWGLHRRLQRGGEGYAPTLVGARITVDGHPYLKNLLAVLGVFSTSCCGGGVGNLEGAGRGSSLRGNEKGMVCNFIVWVGCTQALFTN